jgi:TfoX/Sxy family transcriptional regulator of competence genes
MDERPPSGQYGACALADRGTEPGVGGAAEVHVNNPWPKADPVLVEQFHELARGIEGVEIRKMFGFPAGFVNGNLAFGMYGDSFMARLPADVREGRLAEGWVPFEPMPGRPMREYLALPSGVAADPAAARPWLEQSAAFVATLPPKESKPRRRR